VNYVEEVDKVYDEFQDAYRNLERLIRTTDRLREPDRHLLLIALGELRDVMELLTYVLRLEGSQKTKGDIVAEALRKYIEDSPELRKEVERARQVFHIKGEDRDGGDK
jgi:hypothetical protein